MSELAAALMLLPLRAEALAALRYATMCAETDGISGTLTLRLGRKLSDPVEVIFVSGPAGSLVPSPR